MSSLKATNTILPDRFIHQAAEVVRAVTSVLPELAAWQAPPESPHALIELQRKSTEILRQKVRDAKQRLVIQTAIQVLACAYRMQWGQATDNEQIMALSAWKHIDPDMVKRMIDSYFDARNREELNAIRSIFGG